MSFLLKNFASIAIGAILLFAFVLNDSMPVFLQALASGVFMLIVWRFLSGDEPA